MCVRARALDDEMLLSDIVVCVLPIDSAASVQSELMTLLYCAEEIPHISRNYYTIALLHTH